MTQGTLTKFNEITMILPKGKVIVKRGQPFPADSSEDLRKKFIENGVFTKCDDTAAVAVDTDDAAGKAKKR